MKDVRVDDEVEEAFHWFDFDHDGNISVADMQKESENNHFTILLYKG